MLLSPPRSAAVPSFLSYLQIACLAFLIFTPLVWANAQGGVDSTGTGGRNKIQGRIYFPSGRRSDALTVRVTLESTSSERLSLIADLNGGFVFTSIAAGSYNLTVDAGSEYEIFRESISVEGQVRSRTNGDAPIIGADIARPYNVVINLQPKRGSHVDSRPAVLNSALANVPKPALQLYDEAIEAIRAGDNKKAVELLKAAVSYYPEFTIALNELGVQYLHLKQPEKAVETFRSGLKIRPDNFNLLLNYGIALLEKKESDEAETQLRAAIQKNDASWAAHMYLGVTLINLRRYADAEKELLRSLVIGGDDLSLPHYYLGGIYWHNGAHSRAAEELEKYLRLSPKAPDAERIRMTIRDLRGKSSSS